MQSGCNDDGRRKTIIRIQMNGCCKWHFLLIISPAQSHWHETWLATLKYYEDFSGGTKRCNTHTHTHTHAHTHTHTDTNEHTLAPRNFSRNNVKSENVVPTENVPTTTSRIKLLGPMVDCVLGRQSAGLHLLDKDRWTLCFQRWCLLVTHSHSLWTVFPRCQTLNMMMLTTLSSASCCCCWHTPWHRFTRCTACWCIIVHA